MNPRIVVCFAALACLLGACGKRGRIVGGRDADIEEFPYAVSIRYYKQNQHFCGGSIISESHILTAAHCLYKKEHRYHNVRVYTGTTNLTDMSNGSIFKLKRVYFHPNYTMQQTDGILEHHDIAIVKIAGVVAFNDRQQKVRIRRTASVGKKVGILAGWGALSFELPEASENLQYARMIVFNNSDCSEFLPFELQEEQFCAFNSDVVSACIGDSGSPLAISGELAGLVSFSIGDCEGFPDIYTKVHPYIDFIESILANDLHISIWLKRLTSLRPPVNVPPRAN